MSYNAILLAVLALPCAVVMRAGILRGIRHDTDKALGWLHPPGPKMTALITALLVLWVVLSHSLWEAPYEQVVMTLFLWTYTSLGWNDIHRGYIPYTQAIPLLWAGLLFSPIAGVEARVVGAAALWFLLVVAFTYASWRRGEDVTADGDLVMVAASGAWLGYPLVLPYMVIAGVLGVALHALLWRVQGRQEAPFGVALALAVPIALTLDATFELTHLFRDLPLVLPGS